MLSYLLFLLNQKLTNRVVFNATLTRSIVTYTSLLQHNALILQDNEGTLNQDCIHIVNFFLFSFFYTQCITKKYNFLELIKG